jgi:hypothetical protein
MSGFPAQHRRRFLNAGVEDTLRWCAGPDASVIGNYHTDQYWMQAFAPKAEPVDAETARWFLGTLKLGGEWDYEAVARLINNLRTTAAFVPDRDIPAVAHALRRLQNRDIVCTTAASKLVQIMFPAAEVYVWQELAWQAVLLRQQNPLSDMGLLNAPGWYARAHDYAAYHVECRRILQQEMARDDFAEAVNTVTGLVRTISGPLADPAVPDAFFQRYLLSKVLFHEGWHTKFGRMAHCDESMPANDQIRPGLYQRLRSYIRLGGTEAMA